LLIVIFDKFILGALRPVACALFRRCVLCCVELELELVFNEVGNKHKLMYFVH